MHYYRIATRLFSSQRALDAGRVEFVQATPADLPQIVDMCVEGFSAIEPHLKAWKIGKEARPLFELIGANALKHRFSYKLIEQDSQELVGFRLFSLGRRDDPELQLDGMKLHPGVLGLAGMLDYLKKESFAQLPHINKLIRREITFVVPELQRKGIANRLAHHGLDFPSLKADGVQGLISEASSLANQELLRKKGYRLIAQVPQSYYDRHGIKLHDGTTTIKAYFKDIED
ncbi:unnamed protein product, partial [Mesorhabditis spiculigera]